MTVVEAPAPPAPPSPGARSSWVAGWHAFWRDAEPVLWPALLAAGGWVLAWVLVWLALGSADDARARTAIAFVVFLVLGQLFWATLVGAGLRADGLPVRRPRTAVAAAVVIGLLLGLAFVIGPIGPVLVAVLTQFTLVGVLRDDLGVLAALVASVRFAGRAPGRVLGFTALSVLTLLGGLVLLVVGTVPAAVVVVLAQLRVFPAPSAPR